jgi:hypothetical protein
MVINILEGAIVGGIVSLITLLINWEIEKRKKRFLWRKEFIGECKKTIGENKFNPDSFRETSYYSNLKPHLSNALQREVSENRYAPGKVMTPEGRGELIMKEYAVKKKLLDEISVLEHKWGLL